MDDKPKPTKQKTCPDCHGTGLVGGATCATCKGSGSVPNQAVKAERGQNTGDASR